MTERICEHCGQQFLAETVIDKLVGVAWFLIALILPFQAVDCFKEGWHGLLPGLGLLALAVGAGHQLYLDNKRKKGEVVKLGRACPSCGNRTAHVDSPLGEQLIEYWSAPQEVGQQDIAEQSSTVPCEVEEAVTVASHNRSPFE
jgi:ribosomal protein S27AE